MRLTCLSVIY